jgi:hypothetical protein
MLLGAYKKMTLTKGRRLKGAQKVNGMAMAPAFGLAELIRRVVAALRKLVVKPPSESWEDAPEKPAPTPMGLKIRERR